MLPKQKRLRKRNDINLVHSKGKSFFTPYFIIKYIKTDNDFPRVTVVTSAKVHKSAVKRNRLRRIIYGQLKDIDLLPGYDTMILCTKKCFDSDGKIPREDIVKTLAFGLGKAGVVKL